MATCKPIQTPMEERLKLTREGSGADVNPTYFKRLVGSLSDVTKGYRLFNPVTKKVIISRDVTFDEDAEWRWSAEEKFHFILDEKEYVPTSPDEVSEPMATSTTLVRASTGASELSGQESTFGETTSEANSQINLDETSSRPQRRQLLPARLQDCVLSKDDESYDEEMKYAKDILERFKMATCKPIQTPMEERLKLTREGSGADVNPTYFKRLVGSLRYLTSTRPDLVYSVGLSLPQLSQANMPPPSVLLPVSVAISSGALWQHENILNRQREIAEGRKKSTVGGGTVSEGGGWERGEHSWNWRVPTLDKAGSMFGTFGRYKEKYVGI
ncbi:hypothetical protein CRG98_023004 [Punica granatum]|uniref:Retroviral polymerase SH3-like domain-containing protein n=1 Tax=Punica granatum TaxID=22663 RepID=A0A2I0JK19_PUNGR|nr:hypothetical protein CRG98_023004 [Punica granatum]